MRQRNTIFAAFAAIFILFLAAPAAHAAWNSADEVRRLNREAPSLDGFKGAEGLVWLDNNDYRMIADGSMEKTSYNIVMVGETVPEGLTDHRITVPFDGIVEIIDASWYNPMTGIKEGSLTVSEETLAGGAVVKRISAPNSTVGRAVVVVTREIFPRRYGVDGVAAMAGSLPRWEQNLTVEVADGQELAWTARDVKEPQLGKDGLTTTYKWTVMNQQPWHGEGFVEYKRPFVAFGVKKGEKAALTYMANYASAIKVPPLPAFAREGDKAKNGVKLMQWIAEPVRSLPGYPKGWIRQNEQIPASGPWTPWEQTLILNKWLEEIGWSSEVWWQAAAELGEDVPVTKDMFVAPVLRVAANGGAGKKVYYQAGQASDFGVTTPSITASALYRINHKDEVEKRTASPGSASDHKLSMLWKLKLGEDGVADGVLEVMVTGGWTELFSGGQMPEKKNLGEFLRRRINFAMPGMELTPTAVTPLKTGYKMEFAVRCAPGIIHGGNLLLRLPGGVPQRLSEMIGQENDYTFRFPFIIDQKVRMRMPSGYKMVQPPAIVNRGDGSKATLKQSITHWPKKAELIADSTWVVKTRSVDAVLASLLKDELAACLRWPVLNLPFRK